MSVLWIQILSVRFARQPKLCMYVDLPIIDRLARQVVYRTFVPCLSTVLDARAPGVPLTARRRSLDTPNNHMNALLHTGSQAAIIAPWCNGRRGTCSRTKAFLSPSMLQSAILFCSAISRPSSYFPVAKHSTQRILAQQVRLPFVDSSRSLYSCTEGRGSRHFRFDRLGVEGIASSLPQLLLLLLLLASSRAVVVAVRFRFDGSRALKSHAAPSKSIGFCPSQHPARRQRGAEMTAVDGPLVCVVFSDRVQWFSNLNPVNCWCCRQHVA